MKNRGIEHIRLIRPIRLAGLVGLVGLASCSSGETPDSEEPQEQQPIGFLANMAEDEGAADSRATRAVGDGEFQLDNVALREKGFGVYCWYTGKRDVMFKDSKGTTPSAHISTFTQYMLMNNQKVEYDNGTDTWGYTPAKYWPLDPIEKLTFRAYAPYTSYLMSDVATGLPLLPVVVSPYDYHNGTQHDPLWGTGKLVNPSTEEYYPDNPPPPAEQIYPNNKKYGTLYNNITYNMSGDWRDKLTAHVPADTRDGFIDWYFHHGMAKLVFWGLLDDKSSDPVTATITSITLTPLYSQGLLDISSPAASSTEKPYWQDRGEDMDVEIAGTDLDNNSIRKFDEEILPNKGWTQLTTDGKGLLIIPRDYTLSPMTLTVTFKREGNENVITMSTTITQEFLGNTVYSLKMKVSNALYVEIDVVKAAFSPWTELDADHEVYNW